MKKARFINALYIAAGLVLALLIGGAGAYVYLRGTYKPSTKCANESHSVWEQQTSNGTATDVIDSNTRNNSTDAPACTKGTLKTYTNEHLGDFSFDYLDTDWTLTETTTPKGAGQEYLPDDILITLASEHDDGKIEISLISSNIAGDGGGPGTCIQATRGLDYDVFGNDTYYRSSFTGWTRQQADIYSYEDHIIPISKMIDIYKNNPDSHLLNGYINTANATTFASVDELPETGYCTSNDSTTLYIRSDIPVDPSKSIYQNDRALFIIRITYTGPDIKSAEKVFKTIGGLQ